MKSSSIIFLAAFIALSASWGGFVLVPQLQLGRADQAKTVPAEDKYPIARPGLAQQGAEVYRSLGCVYCHSQQVGQTGPATPSRNPPSGGSSGKFSPLIVSVGFRRKSASINSPSNIAVRCLATMSNG